LLLSAAPLFIASLYIFFVLSLLTIFITSSIKVQPVKFTSNQNKHDVFRSASNAARDFPGRVRLREYLTLAYSTQRRPFSSSFVQYFQQCSEKLKGTKKRIRKLH
jgi:hypothetical protein